MPPAPESLRTALALAAVAAGALAVHLGAPAADLDAHLWGPERPWTHWDLLCGWWLFQAAGGAFGEAGVAGIEAGTALLRHPGGEAPWPTQFPNPWDALLLGPAVVDAPFPRWWNLLQLSTHVLNLLAATWLFRAAGARASSAAAAGLVLAATPVMLHEVAGGRTITGVVWPGLIAWGLVLWGGPAPLRPSLRSGHLPPASRGEGRGSESPSPRDGEGARTAAPSPRDAAGARTPAPSPRDRERGRTPATSPHDGERGRTPAPSPRDAAGARTPAPSPRDGERGRTPDPSPRDAVVGGGAERSEAEGGNRAALRALTAGLLIGLQGLAYLYTGLLAGIVGLLLCRDRRQLTGLVVGAAIPVGAYLLWLLPAWHGGHAAPPPAGFTQLPLAGLLGLDLVADRFRLHPALLLGLLGAGLSLRRGRLLLALGILLLVALGPAPTWAMGDSTLGASPLALLLDGIPQLGRMHHPVRAALLLAPLLALGLAHLLDRLPGPLPLLGALLALPMVHATRMAVGWPVVAPPPGLAAAAWLPLQPGNDAVVDLTGHRGAALSLHPVHGRPLLSGFGPDQDGLRGAVSPWREGAPVSPETLDALGEAGFAWVLAVDRDGPLDPGGLEAQLGPPVFAADGAAVYALP